MIYKRLIEYFNSTIQISYDLNLSITLAVNARLLMHNHHRLTVSLHHHRLSLKWLLHHHSRLTVSLYHHHWLSLHRLLHNHHRLSEAVELSEALSICHHRCGEHFFWWSEVGV